jgi:hypothetical protein
MKNCRLVFRNIVVLGRGGLNGGKMKRLLVLILVSCVCTFAEKVALKEMVIVSVSTRVNPAMGNGKVCWVTASDGNTVYTGYQQKYAFGFVGCPVIEMNSHVRGGVDRKQKYLMLLLPHGNKTKQETYTITDMQAAQ